MQIKDTNDAAENVKNRVKHMEADYDVPEDISLMQFVYVVSHV
jgi:hypothetical protein